MSSYITTNHEYMIFQLKEVDGIFKKFIIYYEVNEETAIEIVNKLKISDPESFYYFELANKPEFCLSLN